MRIGLVVDSACDLPRDFLEREQVELLPITVRIGDAVQVDHRDEAQTLAFLESHIAERGASADQNVEVFESVMSTTGMVNVGRGAVVVGFAAPENRFD